VKPFAELLDRLLYAPQRNAKLALMGAYFRDVPDPDRGWGLAALSGSLALRHAKPGLVRELAAGRADPVLFAWSHDFVGDLAETAALLWPGPEAGTGDWPSWARWWPGWRGRAGPGCRGWSRAGSTGSTPRAAGRC
jgi:DNA ligase-1